ncbi:MAG: hypothetical protein WC358_12165 [Ignavibacteria bacterium]
MSTNFVEEKLCNNNFECDTCSFDKEMKDTKHRKEPDDSIFHYSEPNLLDDVIHKLNKLKSFTYPLQYYFNNCFVLKKFLGDTYFLGFNPMLNVLLDNVTSSDIYGPSQVYKKDEKFLKIQGDWGSVDISAPFNFSLESEVLPLSLKPESGKWLGFIKYKNGNLESFKNGKEDFNKSIESACNNLRKYIKKYVTVGATMYDGGEKLKYIYQVIGKENYVKILKQILL